MPLLALPLLVAVEVLRLAEALVVGGSPPRHHDMYGRHRASLLDPLAAPLAAASTPIPTTTTTTTQTSVRTFSAKTRKRKEEERRKRKEERRQKRLSVEAGEEATTEVEAEAAVVEDTIRVEERLGAPAAPVVTQTKANSPNKAPHDSNASPAHDTTDDVLFAARPEDEEEEEPFESQFDMPDREKETQLNQMQAQVAELYKQGNYKKALEVAQETLLATLDHFGITHPATASSYVNVGLAYKQLGNFELALEQYQKALQAYADTVGTDHASYAMVLHNLGMLYQSQIHLDDSAGLKQQDRLRYNEMALEYLQQADAIRSVELPPEHPHVVATKSALGMTLTSHILHQHKRVSTAAGTGAANAANITSNKTDLMSNAATYIPTLPQQHSNVTEQSWAAAEEHLQSAYKTALQNPRGESSLKRTDKNHYLNLEKKYNLQQKRKAANKGGSSNEQQQQQQDLPTIPLQTASAASAAQNLAVFYKARSTTLEKNHPRYTDYLQQAQDLYQAALRVRQALLPSGHPDIYITQYSLAELYDYSQQKELAQELRQTIVDTYDPPTKGNQGKDVLKPKPKQKKAGR